MHSRKKGSIGPSGANSTVSLLLNQYCLSITSNLRSYKAIRTQQNQCAYQRRKGASDASSSDASLCIPRLPADLIDLADFPLPTSSIFQHAAHSADVLEDTKYEDPKLAIFDGCPPYRSCQDITPRSHDMDRLTDALHGRRLRQQREYEDSRLAQYRAAASTSDRECFEREIHALMMEYLKEWEDIGIALTGLAGCDQDLNIRLGQHSCRWCARRCFSLCNDLYSCTAGLGGSTL
jgi:hypothetical protein